MIVKDFFQKVDVANASSWSEVSFAGVPPDEQTLVNLSGVVVEISFDGSNVHGELAATGATSVLEWNDHTRGAVYLRRQTGTGGGPLYVHVYANGGA